LVKLLPYILLEKYINISALEITSPGNWHCAYCIGALSIPIDSGAIQIADLLASYKKR